MHTLPVQDPGITVIRALRAPMDDQQFSQRYLSSFYALHWYDYHGRIHIGADEFTLQPGDVTLTPAHVPARYDVPQPGSHLVIHFQLPKQGRSKYRLRVHHRMKADAEAARLRFMRVMLHTRPAAESKQAKASKASKAQARYARVALFELLSWLQVRQLQATQDGVYSGHVLDQVVELLQQMMNKPVSIPELAARVGRNQNELARQFKQRYGMTMLRYLHLQRMQLARDLLRTTDLPVKLIAARVGIPDAQYFNKQYRAYWNCSPSAERQRA